MKRYTSPMRFEASIPSQVTLPDGTQLPLCVRVNKRARSIRLSYHPLRHEAVLTLPRRALATKGMKFLATRLDWLKRAIGDDARIRFVDGAVFPLQGMPYRIVHRPSMRGVVALHESEREIHVSGDAAFLSRRLKDWLKGEAKRRIAPVAYEKAARIECKLKRITVRDTVSRWGSCSATSALSFSWRLIFAPAHVLEYVVAHEVAHLRYMSHGPRFWGVVETLHPAWRDAEAWLKRDGATLHRIAI